MQSQQPRPTHSGDDARFLCTRFCWYYPDCFKGADCPFAHHQEELRSRPNLVKTRLCMPWCNGSCDLDARECRYAHGEEDLAVGTAATSVAKDQLTHHSHSRAGAGAAPARKPDQKLVGGRKVNKQHRDRQRPKPLATGVGAAEMSDQPLLIIGAAEFVPALVQQTGILISEGASSAPSCDPALDSEQPVTGERHDHQRSESSDMQMGTTDEIKPAPIVPNPCSFPEPMRGTVTTWLEGIWRSHSYVLTGENLLDTLARCTPTEYED